MDEEDITMDDSGGAPDMGKLSAMLREMADRISQMQSMLPQADLVDEGNAEGEAEAAKTAAGAQGGDDLPDADDNDGTDAKADTKSRAAIMIARAMK